MLQVGVFGDEAALNLASNVLSVDIAVITAFRESSIHKGFGITVIKALEADIQASFCSSLVRVTSSLHIIRVSGQSQKIMSWLHSWQLKEKA